MKIKEFRDYRQVLRFELNEWCGQDRKHSLGDFARHIGLTASRLSEVLSEKKGLSRLSAQIIAGRLKYDAVETEYFCDLVESKDARSSALREAAKNRVNAKTGDREADLLQALSDWHHFAIMELTRVKDFKSTTHGISETLGIPVEKTAEALDRLMRLKVIKENSGNYRSDVRLEARDMNVVLNRWISKK